MATVRPEHAEAQEDRDGERPPLPDGPSMLVDRDARAAGPSGGRCSRPAMAVTNSAVESSSTRAISQAAGTTVRYGSRPKPTTIQATTHSGEERAGVAGVAEQPAVDPGEREPDRGHPARLPAHGYSGSRHPRRTVPASTGPRAVRAGRQPSIAGSASPRRSAPDASAASTASRSVATSTMRRPGTSSGSRRAPAAARSRP